MGDPHPSEEPGGPPGDPPGHQVDPHVNVNKDVTLNNPVLCVIIGWFEKYPKADVYNRVNSVFDFNEVKEAKKLLCNNEDVKDAAPGKDRKGPSVQLVLDDLWACWKKLSDAKQLPKFIIDSSAVTKIPMIHPSQESDQTRDERLQNLEQMVSVLVKKNLEMCEQMGTLVDSLKHKPNSSGQDIRDQQGSWADRLGARPRDKTPALGRVRQTEDYRSQSPNKRLSVEEHDEQEEFRFQGRQKTHAGGPRHHHQHQNNEQRQYQQPTDGQGPGQGHAGGQGLGQGQAGGQEQGQGQGGPRSLRSARAPVVRGTAMAPPGGGDAQSIRPGWKSPPRDLFVYHTAHETTEDDIKDLISMTSKVTVTNVEKRSNEFAYYGSFRVTINRADFEKALDPVNWPAGWSVREYFHSRRKNVGSGTGQGSPGEASGGTNPSA